MEISEIINNEEFTAIIINELKDIGVKCRKGKKSKIVVDKSYRRRIFRTHLCLLELTDVILANGRVVQIPKFVADACNRILEQVETEGIFRKAGSSLRQKEIRISLESGVPLGKSHHVIDVANVVKFFFRELPEPLIPPSIQDTLLRSLLIGEDHVKAILLTCLLLPPLTINTLSFFMQFLYTVSLSDHANKMSIENLAIIFTPGLMPFPNINSHRFTNHVKMVHLLIENANAIGSIPNIIASKLQRNSQLIVSATTDSSTTGSAICTSTSDILNEKAVKKRKKRRSGSLTQMFNGLRKIVGSAIGSSEHLDNTQSETKSPDAANNPPDVALDEKSEENLDDCLFGKRVVTTPCHKSNKKRRFAEPVCAFSAKKKRDLLALLPSNSGGLLPNTPLTKEPKKARLSLGGSRHIKNIAFNPVITSMERRWSVVGAGWSRNKSKHIAENKHFRSNDCMSDVEHTSGIQEKDCGANEGSDDVLENSEPLHANLNFDYANKSDAGCEIKFDDGTLGEDVQEEDCLKISKNEYEEIKERVAAIEYRISHEFEEIRNSVSVNAANRSGRLSGPERVQTQYERMVVETEALSSPATEQLAQRLSRGLKIRRSTDQRVIRSPSARKIGTMRRRSQDNIRLSRNPAWGLSSTNQDVPSKNAKSFKAQQQLSKRDTTNSLVANSFYSKGNLRRGKPNTLNTDLSMLPQKNQHNSDQEADHYHINECLNEQWMSGEVFFSDFVSESTPCKANEVPLSKPHVDHVKTPVSFNIQFDNIKTPMLPPKSLPRKSVMVKTPSNSVIKPSTTSKLPFVNRIAISTPIDDEASGRASIARLRTQNAGMVMAKAKLFDGMGNCESECREIHQTSSHRQQKRIRAVSSNHRITPEYRPFENIGTSIEINVNMSAMTTPKTTLKNTPIAKRIHNISMNSPTPSRRPQRLTAVKSAQKHLLQTIVTDEKLIRTRNLNNLSLNRVNETINSPREDRNLKDISSPRTPKCVKLNYLNLNSPKRIRKHHQQHQHTKFRSAMNSPSGNHTKRTMHYRNSPRNVGCKPVNH